MKKRVIAIAILTMLVWLVGCSVPQATVSGKSNDGLFAIICKPASAEVYVDGRLIGKTSKFDGNPGYLQIASGTHRLEIRKDGYQTWVRDIYSSNAIQTINVTLTPQNK